MYRKLFIFLIISITFFMLSCITDEKIELENMVPESASILIKVDNLDASLTKIDTLKTEIYPAFGDSIKKLAYDELNKLLKDTTPELIDYSRPVAFAMIIKYDGDKDYSSPYLFIPSKDPEKALPIIKSTIEKGSVLKENELKAYPKAKYLVVSKNKEAFDKIDPSKKNVTLFDATNLVKEDIYFSIDLKTIKKETGDKVNQLFSMMDTLISMQLSKQDPTNLNKQTVKNMFDFLKIMFDEIETYKVALSINDKGLIFKDNCKFKTGGQVEKYSLEQAKVKDEFIKYLSSNSIFSYGSNFNASLFEQYSTNIWNSILSYIGEKTNTINVDEAKQLVSDGIKLITGVCAVNCKFNVTDNIKLDISKKENLSQLPEIFKIIKEKTEINFNEIVFLKEAEKAKDIIRKLFTIVENSDLLSMLFKNSKLQVKPIFEKDKEIDRIKFDQLKLNLAFDPSILAEVTEAKLDKDTLQTYMTLLEDITDILTVNLSYQGTKSYISLGTASQKDLKKLIDTDSVEAPLKQSKIGSLIPDNSNLVYYFSLSSLGNALSKIEIVDPNGKNPFAFIKKTDKPSGFLWYGGFNGNSFSNGIILEKEEIKYWVNLGFGFYDFIKTYK